MFYAFNDFGHSSLISEPPKVFMRVCERICDDASREIDGRRMDLEVKNAVVEAVLISCYHGEDVLQCWWG